MNEENETLILIFLNPRFPYSMYVFIRHAKFCKWNGIYALNFGLLFSPSSLIISFD